MQNGFSCPSEKKIFTKNTEKLYRLRQDLRNS